MSMSIDWNKVGEAMDDGNGIVTPGTVVEKSEPDLAFDEIKCVSCGETVKVSHFICPHCNGKVRTPARVEKPKAARSLQGINVALWTGVGLLAVIVVMLAISFGYTNLIDERYSIAEKNSIRIGMKAECILDSNVTSSIRCSIQRISPSSRRRRYSLLKGSRRSKAPT